MNNILIVGAHYDDAELAVAGTAAKLVDEGKNVYKLTLTDNETDSEHLNLRIEYEKSLNESGKACEVLGVTELVEFEPIKCNYLTYDTEVMQRIESIIYKYEIDTIFIHCLDDMNQDHIAAHNLCKTASRHCDNVLTYQSNIYALSQAFYPTYFVDVTDYIEKKIEALNQYTDGHDRFQRLFETTIERNKVWGYSNKVQYAEGFVPIKALLR